MYSISIKNFRGFHEQDYVEVKPLTILVGENSAGKTSFLACVKYMLDFISGDEEASFNKDPFHLGTFQQIAHYRGGKPGRAKQFCLRLQKEVRNPSKERGSSTGVMAEFSATLQGSDAQPYVSEIQILTNQGGIVSTILGRKLKTDLILENGRRVPLEDSADIPLIARSDFSRYWPFILRDLRYRILRQEKSGKTLESEKFEQQINYFTHLSESFSRSISGSVEATSAIRTKPLRTYTPGAEAPDGEGSHVPYELAKLYRSNNNDAWQAMKRSIENYGAMSGMFKEIGVKSFGNTSSDPFQIQISLDGPKTNIVDLGYGTSQIIPILYNISSGTQRSTHLIQQPEVHLHPKAQAALGDYFVNSYIENKTRFIIETHSDFILDRIRQSVLNKKIEPSDVSILFFERSRLENKIYEVTLDEFGEPISPPESYRQFFIGEELRNLGVTEL